MSRIHISNISNIYYNQRKASSMYFKGKVIWQKGEEGLSLSDLEIGYNLKGKTLITLNTDLKLAKIFTQAKYIMFENGGGIILERYVNDTTQLFRRLSVFSSQGDITDLYVRDQWLTNHYAFPTDQDLIVTQNDLSGDTTTEGWLPSMSLIE